MKRMFTLVLLILLAVCLASNAGAKEKPIIDASDPKAWGGIVFAKGSNTAFALRFATDISGLLDGDSIYEAVREVGSHAPDGSYCRLKWSVAPAPGDMFSIRWEGKIKVPTNGAYTFYLTSDDGCRLWIDGNLLIDEWWDRVPTEFKAEVNLTQGEHDIRLDYYESVGSASVKLEWASEKLAREVVPVDAFTHDGKPGLKGSYYYGTNFQEFAFDRVDEQVAFDFGHGGPLPEKQVEDKVCLEWSRVDDNTVVGKFSVIGNGKGNVLLLAYQPWDYKTTYSINNGVLTGESGGNTLKVVTTPSPSATALADTPDQIKVDYTVDSQLGKQTGSTAAGLQLAITPDKPVYFAASLDQSTPACDPEIIEKRLKQAESDYLKTTPEVEGKFARAGESITNNINWMRLFIPHTNISYVPAGRVWIWSSWTVFEWDGFFNALLASVDNKELAYSMIDALLYAQQENGNIPNVANDPSGHTSVGRSQPQVGSYCVWKLYLKYGRDKDFLAEVYPALKKWHEWWLADGGTGKPRRDGNNDGLLEWGADRANMQDAKFESGMDDAALFDDAEYIEDTWTMNMNSVDCSSLYALDSLMLSYMARELGNAHDEAHYSIEHARMKKLINDHLWNEEEGMYLDRYWDGRFSTHMGCATFYPLIAQVATPEKAQRMMDKLNDPRFFKGDYMIPTISRNDAAWKDQGYWRGTAWPPTNYLAYEGIKGYGFDSEAAMVAESGASLFLENWKNTGTCRELYRSDTGEGGGQKYQSWGPLFSLIVLEEFIDVDPYNGGLRFGSLAKEESTLKGYIINGHKYEVRIGEGLQVSRDGNPVFESNKPVVVRGYKRDGLELRFSVNTPSECSLTLHDGTLGEVIIDGEPVTVESSTPVRFKVIAGRHDVICKYSQ